MKRLIIVLLLAGCASTGVQTVPESMHAEVPADAAANLERMQIAIEDLQQQREQRVRALDQAQQVERSADLRLEALEKQIEATELEERAAEQTGDREPLVQARVERAELQSEHNEARNRLMQAEREAERADARLDVLDAEIDLRKAELAEARARALHEAGRDVDLARFEIQTGEYRKEYQEERQRADALE